MVQVAQLDVLGDIKQLWADLMLRMAAVGFAI
jgi:hypothetical protein